jgi:hypothetical protein
VAAAAQVTWTAWLADEVVEAAAAADAFAGAELMRTNALPELPPWATVTVKVTDWPARNVPCPLLSVNSADEVVADQVSGPPTAVSVS